MKYFLHYCLSEIIKQTPDGTELGDTIEENFEEFKTKEELEIYLTKIVEKVRKNEDLFYKIIKGVELLSESKQCIVVKVIE